MSIKNNYGPTLPISEEIHKMKYRNSDETFYDAMTRIAGALQDTPASFKKFREILLEQRFLPAGRVQAAMGSTRRVTAFNCYVSGELDDSFNSIMDLAKEAGLTMRQGGGIGYNFSTLRPRGSPIVTLESQASGPVSFMDIYDAVCRTISSAGHRRGAQMGVLRVDHPDVMEFIKAKQNTNRLTNFNISLAVTDKFMEAVEGGQEFDLKFKNKVYKRIDARALWEEVMRSTWMWAEPGILFIDRINELNNLYYCETIYATNPCVVGDTLLLTDKGEFPIKDLVGTPVNIWNGQEWSIVTPYSTGYNKISTIWFSPTQHLTCTRKHQFLIGNGKRVFAEDLIVGDRISKFTLPNGDTPKLSVMQIDKHRVIEETFCLTEPLHHTATFNGVVTGQCGEQPLPPYGACLLGSFNLVHYVKNNGFDWKQFEKDIPVVVRSMDNVIDRTIYPLKAQEREAKKKRRMGLGVCGHANAGEILGMMYGSKEFLEFTEEVLGKLKNCAYQASAELADEKGAFALYNAEKYLAGKFIATLSPEVRKSIEKHGIRNSHLTSLAPTGTISLASDNVSSGIEPVFCHTYSRTIQTFDGPRVEEVTDYAFREHGIKGKTATECSADDHLNVLLAAAKHVDSAISKTCNVDPKMKWEDFKEIYVRAWKGGAKGCTTFNPGGKRFGVLNAAPSSEENEGSACYIDPETGAKTCE